MEAIGKHMHNLKVLNYNNVEISDQGLTEIAKVWTCIFYLCSHVITFLQHSRCKQDFSLFQGCPALQSLIISDDSGLFAPDLTAVSDKSLEALKENCPALVQLHINGCPTITQAGTKTTITKLSESVSRW